MALAQREYFRASQLGDGAFGAVLVVYDEDGAEFAAKRFEENEDDGSLDGGVLREVSFLQLLRRSGVDTPRVIRLHDVSTLEGSLCMVMPRLQFSVEKAITGKALTNPLKLQVSQDMLAGLHFLHENGWLHRDVKSANVMVDSEMRGVLIDFSLIKHASEIQPQSEEPKKGKGKKSKKNKENAEERQHTAGVGTPTYTAPEVVHGLSYDFKADTWSAGVVLLELFQGNMLEAEKDKQAFKYIEETVNKMGDKPVPAMLKKLLTVDAAERWSCKEALESPAFEKLPSQSEAARIEWPAMAPAPPAPEPEKKGKNAAPMQQEIAKWCTVLELNTSTERLARVLAGYAPERKHVALHACILASRLHEPYMLDLYDLEDWDPSLEFFGEKEMEAYLASELELLKAADYMLLMPPVVQGDGQKRRRV
jgi:serine/threonine protein kinase